MNPKHRDTLYGMGGRCSDDGQAAAVLNNLGRSECDALLDYRSVGGPGAGVGLSDNPAIRHFDNEPNLRGAARWYPAIQLWLPVPKQKVGGGWRLGRHKWLLPVNYAFNPFDETFRCYQGSYWFTVSCRAAEVLLTPAKQHVALRRHFARRAVP